MLAMTRMAMRRIAARVFIVISPAVQYQQVTTVLHTLGGTIPYSLRRPIYHSRNGHVARSQTLRNHGRPNGGDHALEDARREACHAGRDVAHGPRSDPR